MESVTGDVVSILEELPRVVRENSGKTSPAPLPAMNGASCRRCGQPPLSPLFVPQRRDSLSSQSSEGRLPVLFAVDLNHSLVNNSLWTIS